MTLEQLQFSMIYEMKNGNKPRKAVLSSMVDAVKKAAIDKNCRDNVPESLVDEVLLKYKKMMQEMIDACPAERAETLEDYKYQMAVVAEFAPTLITDEEEIKKMINYILACDGIVLKDGMTNMIMKLVMPKLRGRVDMAVANKVIRKI